jgi:uncharacterized protein YegP (UPF0339 family)
MTECSGPDARVAPYIRPDRERAHRLSSSSGSSNGFEHPPPPVDRLSTPDVACAPTQGMYFRVSDDLGGKPSWWLHRATGECVAWAGRTFDSFADARLAAESFKTSAESARYDAYAGPGGGWRWRAWRSNEKIAASTDPFSRQLNARRAAAIIRDNAGTATGPRPDSPGAAAPGRFGFLGSSEAEVGRLGRPQLGNDQSDRADHGTDHEARPDPELVDPDRE